MGATSIGARVRQYRKQRDFTQRDLAERLEINRTALVNIENDHQELLVKHLIKLCEVLDMDANTLLGLDADPYQRGYDTGWAEGYAAGARALRERARTIMEAL